MWSSLKILKVELPYDLAILLLGIYPEVELLDHKVVQLLIF